MEPLPETRLAIDEYGPFTPDGDLLEHLSRSAAAVRAVVPTCVGITLAMVREGLAFTLVATDEEVAALDAVQYVDGGPCVASVEESRVVTFETADRTDEDRWTLFARATAARHVLSTLTLPILEDDASAVGSVNLYAARAGAFDGRHEEVAGIFGAWAPGAVRDADLGFETRSAARRAPSILRGQMRLHQAVGALVAAHAYDAVRARTLIEDAAVRAGVDAAVVAEAILDGRGVDGAAG